DHPIDELPISFVIDAPRQEGDNELQVDDKGAAAPCFLAAMQIALCVAYFAVLMFLSMYGLHRSHLVLTCLPFRDKLRALRAGVPAASIHTDPSTLPHVTIQLPLFNEATVAERLLEQTAKMVYPRSKLQIQVLDDSTDESRMLARSLVQNLAADPPE